MLVNRRAVVYDVKMLRKGREQVYMENEIKKTPMYKRVLAICGIVVLVGMYLVLLYEALTGSPDTFDVFIGCAAATVAVPILLWLLIWAIGALTGKKTIASPNLMASGRQDDVNNDETGHDK